MELYDSLNEYTRQLPYNMEAEQSVLGSLLLDPSAVTVVLEHLNGDSFYKEQHRELFGIILRMFTAGQPVDIVTVLEEAVREGVFDTPENAKVYLVSLMEQVPTTTNVGAYARIVEEKYYIRSLMTASREIIEECADGQEEAKTLLDAAEQKIFNIRQGRDAQGLTRIDEVILETYDHLQKLSGDDRDEYLGLRSGFSGLDNIMTGLNKSDLILLAARPGMGKTSFALNIASNVAKKHNKPVAVFSLEMSKEQLVGRMLSSEALVQSNSLRTGKLSADEWSRLALAADSLSKAPIYLDDTAGITTAQMKAKLRRVRNLGLVVIDYLQLMSTGKRSDNRVVEISEITRALKIMAKDLNVPVITLSQLSRGPEARTDHRPLLSDLRDSGSIEQDADLVLFLYRDAYYNKESDEQNVSECIVAKNRHGETDTVKLVWDGQFTRFSDPEMFRNGV